MSTYPEVVEVRPLRGPFHAEVTVPGSKSMTNRALILAALADGPSTIENALTSDDTDRMLRALNALEFDCASDATAAAMRVKGHSGTIPAGQAALNVGASGTCARFLTALVALGNGEYALDGVPRMRERPIEPLLDALRQIGADAISTLGTGCLPVRVRGVGEIAGGSARIDASVSSQFISALLMVAPYARDGLELTLVGTIVSRPYIDMTIQQMARAGVIGRWRDERTLRVDPGRYRAGTQVMESDASNASYFFAAAAATGGWVRVPRLPADSIQGDLALLDVLARMGCDVRRDHDAAEVRGPAGGLKGLIVDANAFPDVAQTIAAIAPFADGPVEVRNVASMRVKETDRIAAVATELRRLGQHVEEGEDWFRVTPRPIRPATIRTYDDHRMAMAFSIVGLRASGVRIADPACVAKTFPGYFDVLAAAGVEVVALDPATAR